MNSRSQLIRAVIAIVLVAISGVFLSSAPARQKRPAASSKNGAVTQPATLGPAAPIYTSGSFTFTTPQELLRPLNMVEGELDQSVEPEIKIDLWGNIYITGIHGVPGGVDFWKSTNKGTSFVYLGEPDGAQDKCGVNGPVICQNGLGGGDDSIDVSTGGYLYISSLWAGSVTMSTSYDGGTGGVEPGQKWEVNPVAAGLPSDDRQWVAAYGPQTINMTYTNTALTDPPGNIGLFFTKSTDGGKTFGVPVAITGGPQSLNSLNVEGNLVVDPYNGNLYTAFIPNPGDNIIDLAASTDGGATWRITTAYTGPGSTTNRGVFPILAVDRGGNLHLAFTNSKGSDHTNCHVFLTSSANPAAASPTWTTPVQVDNGPSNNSACLPWIVAGSPGIVDVTWVGSTATSPEVSNATWHVFFAQVTNALTASPTIAQSQVETAIVHNHSICFNGFACAGNGVPKNGPENRDLAEYYTMTIDPDGNANIVYEDSVNGSCGTEMDPLGLILICTSKPWFTKQTAGASAYTPLAGPAPATFSNLALPGSPAAEPDIAVDSHNCIYAASNVGIGSLGPPYFWASENQGLTFRTNNPPPAIGTGDEYIAMIPKQDGTRNDQLYYTDLPLVDVDIFKSTDRGITWTDATAPFAHLDASSDRQWIKGERIGIGGASQVLYEMDHEAAAEAIRFSASVDDSAWSPPASGITDPEMILPPNSTFPNTNPGPVFIDKTTHMVYGVFTASTIKTNRDQEPFGKLPNVWLAFGPGSTIAGLPPGPFVNRPAFKGVFDSPASPQPTPPPGSQTFGSNAANDFPGGAIDSAGNVYVVWATQNARTNQFSVWFASSHDHGQNFYGPFEVAKFPAPPVGSAEMPWIAAGDNGRVDIVYYQTNEAGNPNSTNLHWNTMFAQSFNANSREPVFTVSQVSDHIMHFGPICNLGLLCADGTRELLDFFEVAIGPDGLANITFADTGNANSPSHVTYARQTSGPLALTNPSAVTCLAIPPLASVVSEKVHGSAGPFDVNLPLPTALPSPQPRGVECRSPGQTGTAGFDYKLVFTFVNNIVATTGCGSTSTPAGSVVAGPNANQCTVNLNGLPNAQYTTVTLNSVTDVAGNSGPVASPQMGLLVGDVNANGLVNSTDTSLTQAQSGQAVGASNFRTDINANGLINSTDTSIVRANSGTGLPSSP